MGAGASTDVQKALGAASEEDLRKSLAALDPETHAKLAGAAGVAGPIKCVFYCEGTRGDVQPYVDLIQRLQTVGYQVLTVTNANHVDFVKSFGLEVLGLCKDVHATMGDKEKMDEASKTGIAGITQLFYEGVHIPFWKALDAFQPEFLMFGPTGLFLPLAWAEANKVPAILVLLQEFLPTRDRPPKWRTPLAPLYDGVTDTGDQRWAAWRHWYEHVLIGAQYDVGIKAAIAEDESTSVKSPAVIGRTLKKCSCVDYLMKVITKPTSPIIVANSELLYGRPSDYADQVHITGFLGLGSLQQVGDHFGGCSKPLAAFVDAGKPPIYAGWGSWTETISMDALKNAVTAVVAALKATGQRGVVQCGVDLSEMTEDQELIAYAADNVFFAKKFPHEWLFPKCSAALHHGGAGTIAASIKAGIPTIVSPCMGDQHLWAAWINERGLGAVVNGPTSVTSTELSEAIKKCTEDKTIQSTVATVGAKMRLEDGAGNAVTAIDQFVKGTLRTGEWMQELDRNHPKFKTMP